jgi:hypothetical protein
MKKFLPIIAFMAILLSGCSKFLSNPEYHKFQGFTIGTLQGTAGGTVYIVQDNNTTVLLKGVTSKSDTVFGTRYFAEGMMYQQGYGTSGYDETLEAVTFCSVDIKELIFADNKAEIERISNKGFDFDNYNLQRICQTLNYINIPLTIYADNIDKHAIEYAIESSEKFGSKEIKIYLCHNSNGDTQNNATGYTIFTSLDMSPVFEHYEADDKLIITVIYKDLYSDNKNFSMQMSVI